MKHVAHTRFDFSLLCAFAQHPNLSWLASPPEENPLSTGQVWGDPLPEENKGNTFETYSRTTPSQEELHHLALQFAQRSWGGLLLTGASGVGKTHLAVAVLSYAANHGKKVLYLEANGVGKTFNEISNTVGCAAAGKQLVSQMEAWIASKPDLIILNDLNSAYGFGANFQKMAVTYVLEQRKKLLITAHRPVFNLYEGIPEIYSLFDERSHYFILKQRIEGTSHRKTWFSSPPTIDDFVAYTGGPAGLIVPAYDDNLQSKLEGQKVRVLEEPYRVKEYYDEQSRTMKKGKRVHEESLPDRTIDAFDYFVVHVTGLSQFQQFLHLVSQVFDRSKKLILVTQQTLPDLSKKYYFAHGENKERLEGRIKVLFGDS